jgi:hypothetical protein
MATQVVIDDSYSLHRSFEIRLFKQTFDNRTGEIVEDDSRPTRRAAGPYLGICRPAAPLQLQLSESNKPWL